MSGMSGKVYDGVIRVSRRNGRGEDGEEWSPDRQREKLLKDAERHGFTIDRWHDETDSVSGGTTDRDGLNAATDRAIAGEVDGIAVAKIDRFARTLTGGLATINRLEKADKHLYACREGMIVGPEVDATDKLKRNIMLAIAEWQRDSMSEEWEQIRASHIRRGIHTVTPYGYRKDEKRRLVIHEPEARIVRRIFRERAIGGEGSGWVAIADRLNADGIPTGGNGSRRAAGWSHTRVKSMVENRVYRGEISSGQIVNQAAHPPLVSEDLFKRANDRRDTTGRAAGFDYLLTGMVYCASCGVKMVGNKSISRDGKTTYYTYRCRRNHPFGKCTGPAHVNMAALDEMVERDFRERFFGDNRATMDGVEDTARLEALTEAYEQALAYMRAYPVANRRQMIEDPDGYAAAMEELGDEVVKARNALNAERNRILKVEFPADLEHIWDGLPTTRKRAYLAQAVDLVAVAPVARNTNPPVESRARIFRRLTAPLGIIGRKLDEARPIAF
jgi:DNA invertase Pin-like site-specific DNA recombinase